MGRGGGQGWGAGQAGGWVWGGGCGGRGGGEAGCSFKSDLPTGSQLSAILFLCLYLFGSII